MNAIAASSRGDRFFVSEEDKIIAFDCLLHQFGKPDQSKKRLIQPPASEERMHVNQIRIGRLGEAEMLLVVEDNGTVRAYYVDDLDRPPIILNNDSESTWSLSSHGPTRRLAVGANSHCVTVWNMASDAAERDARGESSSHGQPRSEKMIISKHDHNVPCIDFSPDGCFIASSSIDSTVRVWDAATGRQVFRYAPCREWAWCVRWVRRSDVDVVSADDPLWDALPDLFSKYRFDAVDDSEDDLEDDLEDEGSWEEMSEEEPEQDFLLEEEEIESDQEEEEAFMRHSSSAGDSESEEEESSAMDSGQQRAEQESPSTPPAKQQESPSSDDVAVDSDFLLLLATKHKLFLIDPHKGGRGRTSPVLCRISLGEMSQEFVPAALNGLNRLSLVEWVGELSTAVVASQGFRGGALIRIIRSPGGDQFSMVPECFLPVNPQVRNMPLAGLCIARVPGAPEWFPFRRVYMMWLDGHLSAADVHKNPKDCSNPVGF